MRRTEVAAVLLLMSCLPSVKPAGAQDSLLGVNDSTIVSGIQFRFVDGQSFPESRLRARMATRGPSLLGRIRNLLAFLPLVTRTEKPFDRVELQRDMVRLTRFYRDNGFLGPVIDYPSSQYSAESNAIQVIVTIREGPPLAVRTRIVRFMTPLDPGLNRAWRLLEERLELGPGEQFTEFGRIQLEARLLGWMRDRGYAFAEAAVVAEVDSSAHAVDLRLNLTPGVRATIDRIDVEGITSIPPRIVTRQLPFRVGSLFKADDLLEGQRSLLGLNMFRVALADVPDQPADSLVTVRIRVRESPPNLISANGGYTPDNGLEIGSGWKNRNFLGAARDLAFSVKFTSGLLARPTEGQNPVRTGEASLSLRQPYLGERRLSGSGSLFYRWVDDANLVVRYHEVGISPSLLFQYLPFRTASLQYTLSRAVPIQGSGNLEHIDVFDRSTLTFSFAAGKLNNYLHPRRGWMVRPSFDVAGLGLGGSVAFTRGTIEATGLIPITMRSSVWISLTAGRLFPSGPSRDQSDPQVEYRFDPIRYYAGGATDVRGWPLGGLGPKWVHTDTMYVAADGSLHADGAVFESVGGLGKISGRIEWRVPAPGLGDSWRIGTFLDFGGLGTRIRYDADGRTLFDTGGLPVVSERALPAWSDLRFGTGLGLRYLTPVGALRLDFAWKINPDDLDLESPGDRALYDAGFSEVRPARRSSRRWGIHLSIDRAF